MVNPPNTVESIVVRAATSDDAAAIAEVTASASPELRRTYRPKDSAVGAAFSADVTRLVACRGEHVVGTLLYLSRPDELELFGIDVIEGQRRRGVARAMIEHLAAIGRGSGAGRLTLRTVRETGTAEMFEALGFRVVGEADSASIESDVVGSLTELTMARALGA